jgi:hypothetical protein
MKNRVLSIVFTSMLLAVPLTTADAQNPLKIGARGGFIVGNVEGDDSPDFGSREAFVGGVFTNLPLIRGLVLQPELLYAQKGGEFSTTLEGIPVDIILKMDYIEIPILLKYGFATNGPVTPFILAGPVFSFNVSSKTEFKTSVIGFPFAVEVDNYNEKSTDLGLALGVGADFSLGPVSLVFDARYTTGFQSMWEDVDLSSLPDELDEQVYADEMTGEALDMKNMTIALTVGIMF